MKEFLVGLLVLVMFGVISLLGIVLLPLFLIFGFFLKLIIGLVVTLAVVWLVGKLTLVFIERIKKNEKKDLQL